MIKIKNRKYLTKETFVSSHKYLLKSILEVHFLLYLLSNKLKEKSGFFVNLGSKKTNNSEQIFDPEKYINYPELNLSENLEAAND